MSQKLPIVFIIQSTPNRSASILSFAHIGLNHVNGLPAQYGLLSAIIFHYVSFKSLNCKQRLLQIHLCLFICFPDASAAFN